MISTGAKEIVELVVLAVAFVVWLIRLESKVKDSSDLAKKIDAIRDEINEKFTELERQVNGRFDEARRDTRTMLSEAKTEFGSRLTDIKELVFNANRASNR